MARTRPETPEKADSKRKTAHKRPYHRPRIIGREALEVMAVECIGGGAKTLEMPMTCTGPIGS